MTEHERPPLKHIDMTVDLCDVDTVWRDEYVAAGWAKRWRMAHRRRIFLASCHDYCHVPNSERRGRVCLWFTTLRTGHDG